MIPVLLVLLGFTISKISPLSVPYEKIINEKLIPNKVISMSINDQ
jgi:hypothetical protein